jgi:glutamine synthetase
MNQTSLSKMSILQDKTTSTLIVEYVWIDGYNKTRSKTRIIPGILIPEKEENGLSFHIDLWNYDGSSTGQSDTKNSDIILIPRCIFPDPFNTDTVTCKYFLCICDTFNLDGTAHSTNNRFKLLTTMQKIGETVLEEQQPLFGIEQKYFILDSLNQPYGWETGNIKYFTKQGKFYCGVGSDRTFGRVIAMEHMNACIHAGIKIGGMNSAVAPSQFEFQLGFCEPLQMGDHLWMSRYILERVAEKHGLCISYKPKPFGTKWQESSAHTNFSTKAMRSQDGIIAIYNAIEKLQVKHNEHMTVYSKDNETSDSNTFIYGECDRSSSIHIPVFVKATKCGYFEDRRPSSNADPYLVCATILDTILYENKKKIMDNINFNE